MPNAGQPHGAHMHSARCTLISATAKRRFAPRHEEHAAGSPVLGSMFLVTENGELPRSVLAAYERAGRAGFQLACEAEVGRLLAALAPAVPRGGRVLEIGTSVGVGLAWLVGSERAGTLRSQRSSSTRRCR